MGPGEFGAAAVRYWLGVFPMVHRELGHWRARAALIPDARLRAQALSAQRMKVGSVEGGAAFAVFARPALRSLVVRVLTGYQTAFDYLDVLAEQPNPDPIGNGRQLHTALLAASDPWMEQSDYYAQHAHRADGSYLGALVGACRTALCVLPAHGVVVASLRRTAEQNIAYQSYNHGDAHGSRRPFREWAQREATAFCAQHADADLHWWELGAAAGSSMPSLALVAAAADATLSEHEATAIERAYYPRIAALNSLLDSLIDRSEDAAADRHQLLGYYDTPAEAVQRLRAIALRAMVELDRLQRGASRHRLMLAAMLCFYVHPARSTLAPAQRDALLEAAGGLARPMLLVFRIRDALGRAPEARH